MTIRGHELFCLYIFRSPFVVNMERENRLLDLYKRLNRKQKLYPKG